MKTVIGIDVGGSTTKIVGFTEDGVLLRPQSVKATDPVTSLYGAFGKFTVESALSLDQIGGIMITGVGSSYIEKPIYGLPVQSCPEFACIGRGGLYLSGLERAIVVSMGTGTAIVKAERGQESEYLGGTGVGGGTVMGLSKMLLGMEDASHIFALAESGDLNKIDLRVSDITKKGILGMSSDLTAANFGKVSDLATKNDIALAIINMVFETVGMCSLFAARSRGIRDIVLTGNLTTVPLAGSIFESLNRLFTDVHFLIPENARFGTVIGAALTPRA